MPDPQIQYCTTADGVSIAYYAMGDGPPIVRASTVVGSHLLLARKIPSRRQTMEAQERRHRVVQCDRRGSGLSQRESPDFSLASRLLDLEAVVDHLRLDRFALSGFSHGGLAAVGYAVRHPERVTHLILINAHASGRDYYGSPAGRARLAMRSITKDQWESFTLAAAGWILEFSDTERAKEDAAVLRGSIEPEAMLACRDATLEIDVTDLLPQVRMPTLVLCRPSQVNAQPELSQVLASRIPDARLVVLEPWTGTGADDASLRAIEEFLGDVPAPATQVAASDRSVQTILFTDITDSTALTQRLGDARAQELVRAHNAIVRAALGSHGGTEIKHTGDGIMASFHSASGALECATAIQRAVAQHGALHSDAPLQVHVGINAGEPVAEEQDLFGTSVQLARRICDHSAGGEVLVSDVVRQLAAGKGFLFADRGEVALRGFEDPVRVYEVRWRD